MVSETYGVTGVALIAFLALAMTDKINQPACATLIIWLFAMRALMIITSLFSYGVNEVASKSLYGGKKDFDFEAPLTHLVWLTSAVSIAVTFVASKLLLGDFKDGAGAAQPALWWVLSVIISCGTVAGALIPEFTKVFVSVKSRHVREVTNCSKHGGASLKYFVRFCSRQFLGLLDGPLHHGADGSFVLLLPKCRLAFVPAGQICLCGADLCIRPGGLSAFSEWNRHDYRGG